MKSTDLPQRGSVNLNKMDDLSSREQDKSRMQAYLKKIEDLEALVAKQADEIKDLKAFKAKV